MSGKTRNLLGFFVCITITYAAAAIGGIFTGPSVGTWYRTLNLPPFTPPSWLFGPVWTILYGMMAIALFMVWRKKDNSRGRRAAIVIYAIQLGLNAIWSPVFFGLKNPGAGLVIIILLWFAIATTINAFRRLSRPAALLLIPYLLWVSFAAVLNFAIWRLN